MVNGIRFLVRAYHSGLCAVLLPALFSVKRRLLSTRKAASPFSGNAANRASSTIFTANAEKG